MSRYLLGNWITVDTGYTKIGTWNVNYKVETFKPGALHYTIARNDQIT